MGRPERPGRGWAALALAAGFALLATAAAAQQIAIDLGGGQSLSLRAVAAATCD